MNFNNKKIIYSVIIYVERSISDLVKNELSFRIKKWKIFQDDKLDGIKNISFKIRIDDFSGEDFIFCEISKIKDFENSNNDELKKIINSIFNDIFLELRTVESFGILMNKVPMDEIVRKRGFDFYRVTEEIIFSIDKINIEIINILENFETIDKISIFSSKINISKKNRIDLNNIMMKILDNKKKDLHKYQNSGNSRYLTFFKFILTENEVFFVFEIKKKYFENLIPFNNLIRHQTPINPHMGHILINNAIELLAKNVRSHNRTKNLVIIDPFCGNGTIALLFHINFLFYLSFINHLTGLDIDKVLVYGFDNSLDSIKASKGNLDQLIKSKPKYRELNNKTDPMSSSIKFLKTNIDEISKNFSLEDQSSSLFFIISQPPYGFTIKKSDEELISLYTDLINLARRISLKNDIILSVIFGNDKIFDNLIKFSKNDEISSHEELYKDLLKKKVKKNYIYSFILKKK